jgi:hypothetical protein
LDPRENCNLGAWTDGVKRDGSNPVSHEVEVSTSLVWRSSGVGVVEMRDDRLDGCEVDEGLGFGLNIFWESRSISMIF